MFKCLAPQIKQSSKGPKVMNIISKLLGFKGISTTKKKKKNLLNPSKDPFKRGSINSGLGFTF